MFANAVAIGLDEAAKIARIVLTLSLIAVRQNHRRIFGDQCRLQFRQTMLRGFVDDNMLFQNKLLKWRPRMHEVDHLFGMPLGIQVGWIAKRVTRDSSRICNVGHRVIIAFLAR